jgi:hypothetical protein
LFDNAFPSVESRTKLTQRCLKTAAKNKVANVIKERVKQDDNFVRNLQDLVILSSHAFTFVPNIAHNVSR